MFVVTEAEAAAIRTVYEQSGERIGRSRTAPVVPGRYYGRGGSGVRLNHRRLEGAAHPTVPGPVAPACKSKQTKGAASVRRRLIRSHPHARPADDTGHSTVHVGFFTLFPGAIVMKCQSVAEGLVL
jgi:hypothetical protein